LATILQSQRAPSFRVEPEGERITIRNFMTRRFLFRSAIALFVVAFFANCAEMEMPATTAAPMVAPTPPAGYWNGDGVPGAPKIIVNITLQRAYFFKGKQLVGESTVSTGKKGFSTPPGYYQVLWKDKDHISTVFGDYVDDFGNVTKSNIDSRKDARPRGSHFDGARMPYAMFFRGGYAMHQGYVPPYAASHGCIRLPQGMADRFFDNSTVGTPVVVKESAPEFYSRNEPNNGPPSVLSPAPVLAPAPVRSPAPAPVRSLAPAPVRSSAPAPVRSAALAAVRSPTPSPTPTRARLPRKPSKKPKAKKSPTPEPVALPWRPGE
jgi:hypothetical protein